MLLNKNLKTLYTPVGISIFGAACFSVYLGLDSKIYQINECEAYIERFIVAEYSELDFEMEMDYWTEPASETYIVATVNGEKVYQSHKFKPFKSSFNIWYPPFPPKDESAAFESGFDNFSSKEGKQLKVTLTNRDTGEITKFLSNVKNNQKCINRLGGYIYGYTLFGITYNLDF